MAALEVAWLGDELLLGRHSACLCEEGRSALAQLGVTRLLAADAPPSYNPSPATPEPISYAALPICDDVSEPLQQHLEWSASFIHEAVSSASLVCVSCASGLSTGPAVVMYYLMRHRSLSLAQAMEAVRAVLPEVQPNIGFVQRLIEAEACLRGELTPSLTIQQCATHWISKCDKLMWLALPHGAGTNGSFFRGSSRRRRGKAYSRRCTQADMK
ncbi:MAG: hypothetical protein SGPRY_008872 [Prymnesium sp.]